MKLTEDDKRLLIVLLVECAGGHRKTAEYARGREPTAYWQIGEIMMPREKFAAHHDRLAKEADALRAKIEDSTKPRKATP